MRKVYLTLATVAGMTLAGCTSDEIVVDNNVGSYEGTETPIVFSSLRKGMTRADFVGAEAAEKLGNKFVVSGYKGGATATTKPSIVFDNYLVEYEENTANTTASNTNNWEYVGKGVIKHAAYKGITSQTIKYWDYSQDQYDFLAWSTGKATAIYEGEPAAGQVLVSAIKTNALGTEAYTFTGTAADLSNCYVSDIVTVNKSGSAGVGEVTGYNQPVTLKFRALGTKVRIGIYETIPGYSVKDVKFYSAAASNDANTTPKLFTTTENDIFTEGTYTVTFPTVDQPGSEDNNQAHVTFAHEASTTQSTTIDWGTLNYTIAQQSEKTTGEVFLGRTSNTASFAGNEADNYYVIYLPNEKGTNLNLRVNYTLESIDGSGETIEVKGATAQVPSIYTTWKPGFAYTYLFKISDKTNGFTGPYDPEHPDALSTESNPAGLYPITFDAVVVNAEDNDQMQETITTVSAPSITTYQKGSNVVNQNEYVATTTTGDIFVTVNDGNTESTPDLAHGDLQTLTGKAALYTIPAGKTEADVVDALQMQDDDAATGTIKGRSGLVLTEATSTLTNSIEYGVDGNAISVGTNQALRFTPAAGKTYAFVYTKKAATANTDMFQPVTKAVNESVEGLYRYALTGATPGDAQKGVKYFANDNASTGMLTPFIGQGVSNLYTRSGEGTADDPYVYTIASGLAVTSTDYYYTLDAGKSYIKAANIAYADFAAATDLYTFDGTNYSVKTDTAPVSGTAYYKKTVEGGEDVYTYCVILPQQTNGWYVIDEEAAKVACGATDKAVSGMTYFDKYVQNDGVYYTKVIKVQ